jgi:hypothetical protein
MESLQQDNRLTFSALAQEQSRLEMMELQFLLQLVLHQLPQIYAPSTVLAQLSVHQAITSQ